MGTRSLRLGQFQDLQELSVAEYRGHKQRLLELRRADVSVAIEGAGAAMDEAARLVAGAVGHELDGNRPCLEAAALLVPEDLVVLVRDGQTWRMAAGVVCSPSHWSPPAKLGLQMAAVHEPVPGYATELSQRVDRFLDHLVPGRPAWRRNWTVHASPELYAPEPVAKAGPVAPADHWLRSERQVLSALPLSGSVLFTILTQQVPLSVVRDQPAVASKLAQAMRSMPAALAEYRFGGLDREGIAAWLERTARRPR
jgi:hypothetical protein